MTASFHSRSIPACAGEPKPVYSRLVSQTVYPRVCGGTTFMPCNPWRIWGLSPRVRGNHSGRAIRRLHWRSIPACAGEPLYQCGPVGRGRVYPRVCGGTLAGLFRAASRQGLSPRVRGNPRDPPSRELGIRSIPACAGEPIGRNEPVAYTGVYPRVCGEPGRDKHSRDGFTVYPRVCGGTPVLPIVIILPAGLSPRVRGNLFGPFPYLFPPRSIPACAGEPTGATHDMQDSRPGVYPRVCGGTATSIIVAFEEFGHGGLSPRVRGNL